MPITVPDIETDAPAAASPDVADAPEIVRLVNDFDVAR